VESIDMGIAKDISDIRLRDLRHKFLERRVKLEFLRKFDAASIC